MDWMMNMHRSVAFGKQAGNLPYVLIDIDKKTYRSPQWGGGEPVQTPRDRLGDLITYALQSGANYVVVDIALDGRLGVEEQALVERLAGLQASGTWNANQHLLLVRTFQDYSDDGMLLQKMRPGIGELAPLALPNVHSVAPLFLMSSDRILREWLLWHVACTSASEGAASRWRIIPSVQLQVLQLQRVGTGTAPWLEPKSLHLSQDSNDALSQACSGEPADLQRQKQALVELDHHLRSWFATLLQAGDGSHGETPAAKASHGNDGLSSRIVFTLPWAGEVDTSVQVPRIKHPQRGDELPLLRIVPAALVINGQPPPFDLKGSLAVIGASYEESHDLVFTPLGRMPGSLVLINATNSLLGNGVVHAPSPITTWGVALALIMLISLVTAAIHSIVGVVLALVVVLISLLPISFYLFSIGLWLDFALPLIAVVLHRLIENLHENYRALTHAKPQDSNANH